MQKFKKVIKGILALTLSLVLTFPIACKVSGNEDGGNDTPDTEQGGNETGGNENEGGNEGGGNNGGNETGGETGGETGDDIVVGIDQNTLYYANGFDFGDPSAWAGNEIAVTDLGDCIIDAFPWDERYDWGQTIIYDGDAGLYKMWWCRHSGMDSIWYAESEDLKNWTNSQKVMTVLQDSTWIKAHVGKPSVIKVNGQYIMYFEAPATIVNGKEFNNNVFRATSRDGINWTIDSKNGEAYPVIRMTDSEMSQSNSFANSNVTGYGWYGIGQPSALYVNGTYYVYYTYSLAEGDSMYVSTSTDGVNFSAGRKVFLRAGCGVKYNTLTNKFMMAYERTNGRLSKVYYMESSDGYTFEYMSLTEATNNPKVLTNAAGFVRGYPDFVGDEHGQIHSHTAYATYMEGTMSDPGVDWRQYADTWDIHIAAFNIPQYANRAMVLPNNTIANKKGLEPYKKSHERFEDRLVGIDLMRTEPVIDAVMDDVYKECTVLNIDRQVSLRAAVPSSTTAIAYVGYTKQHLYVLIKARDSVTHTGDFVTVSLSENVGTSNLAQVVNIKATRGGAIAVTDGNGRAISNVVVGVERTSSQYIVEMKIPWRYKTTQQQYDSVGFDILVYDNETTPQYLSILAWSDYRLTGKTAKYGELYFK